MRERYQGGSLTGFIVVGVLLALVLVGGLYGLNRYNAQRASDETTSQESESQPANDEKTTEKPTSSNEDSDKATPESTSPATSEDKTPAASDDAPSAATTAALPETGPADTMISLLAVGLLGFASAHYVRSRRAAHRHN
jgi:cytoskeletal protein RodZ